jgi:hypothetical protein
MKPQSTVKQEIDCSGQVVLSRSIDGRRKRVLTCLSAKCWIRVSALIALSIFGLRAAVLAQAAPSRHRPCEIRATEFEGWKAQEISNEWSRIIIVPQLGGRLMQVSFDGHEFIFVNPKYKGQCFPASSANGKWFNYGGDKIWPMPEGRDDAQHWPGPISDELDDGEYQFSVLSRSPACTVRLDGPPEPRTGLQYSREITIGVNSPEISFQSIMKNASDQPIRWSMQTVTQYDTADRHNPKEYNRDFWAMTPLNPQSAYFNKYQVRSGLADDPSFSAADGMFHLHWLYLENEVWLDSTAGWLAVNDAATNYSMVERFQFQPGAEYPGNASLIFYKNGAAVELDPSGKPVLRGATPDEAPYYMEAEINSPMIELRPGQSYTMKTNWLPTRAAGRISSVTDAGVIVQPITAATMPNGVLISGSVGVFFPGKLAVRFEAAKGRELQSVDLLSVMPQAVVELKQQIKPPSQAEKVVVHLVDQDGIDRGVLGEAPIQSVARGL